MRNNEERAQLLAYIPLLINTHSTPEVEQQRGIMAADWLIRCATPTLLRLAGLAEHANRLEQLPPITSFDNLIACSDALDAAKTVAWETWNASDPPAADLEAPWDAGATVVDGIIGTVRAAWAATRDAWAARAAWGAARDAAWVARAAGEDLEPTTVALQESAHRLFRAMIECRRLAWESRESPSAFGGPEAGNASA